MVTILSPQHRLLARVLKEARIDAGMRQLEVAEALGQPQSFVSKYEAGERRLDVLEIWRICQALRLDFVALMTELQSLLEEHGAG